MIEKVWNFMWLDIDSSLQTNDWYWLDSSCDSTLTRKNLDDWLERRMTLIGQKWLRHITAMDTTILFLSDFYGTPDLGQVQLITATKRRNCCFHEMKEIAKFHEIMVHQVINGQQPVQCWWLRYALCDVLLIVFLDGRQNNRSIFSWAPKSENVKKRQCVYLVARIMALAAAKKGLVERK